MSSIVENPLSYNRNRVLTLASMMVIPLQLFVWRNNFSASGAFAIDLLTAVTFALSANLLRGLKWWYFLVMYFSFMYSIKLVVYTINDYDAVKLVTDTHTWPFSLSQNPQDDLIRAYLVFTNVVSVLQPVILSLPFAATRRYANITYLYYNLVVTSATNLQPEEQVPVYMLAAFLYKLAASVDDRQTPMYLLTD